MWESEEEDQGVFSDTLTIFSLKLLLPIEGGPDREGECENQEAEGFD